MTGLDDDTRAIAEAAAARLRVPAGDAELIHLHSNATVALPSAGLVLRIATNPDALDRIRGSVRVCRWLAARGYPCTVPADAEPWTEAGRTVSVWRYEDVIPGPPASMAEFGTLLRTLHDEPRRPSRSVTWKTRSPVSPRPSTGQPAAWTTLTTAGCGTVSGNFVSDGENWT